MKLDKLCIIADKMSVRYPTLQGELDILTRFVSFNSTRYCYKYQSSSISDYDYYQYWTWPDERMAVINWWPDDSIKSVNMKGGSLMLPKHSFSLALNHVFALKLMSEGDENMWSMVCEDDLQIPDKDNFENDINQLLTTIPDDADIIWPSSGKKNLDCTYADVCGFDPSEPITTINNFFNISRSRYTDCILIKNKTAKFLADKLLEHRIATPIDWEYNYLLKLYPHIKSYWLSPAIFKQNLDFETKPV